jgi:RNA polymerase sigma factor (sigma-70 family)
MATVVDDVRDRAFERMYETYVRDVYRYVLAVLRNPADAEDVTQTTFLNAYRAFQRGEQPHKPQNWLITIAHNACRTRAIRSARRPREVPLDDLVTQLAVPERERVNVRELLQALGRLPFNQRAAIAMRELEGRSYEEIAETLDVTVPAVEALLVRARRTLRAQHAAVRGLAVVQLPRSLRSLWQNSEATSAVAGGLVGGGALVKAAAVLVAGVVAGGAGYAVEAGIATKPALEEAGPRPPMRVVQSRVHRAASPVSRRAPVARGKKRPEPSGTARRMPVPPGGSTAVAVALGGATAPVGRAGTPDSIWSTAQQPAAVHPAVAAGTTGGRPARRMTPPPLLQSPLVPPLSAPPRPGPPPSSPLPASPLTAPPLPVPHLPGPHLPGPPLPGPPPSSPLPASPLTAPPPPAPPLPVQPPVPDVPHPVVPTLPRAPTTPDPPRVPTLPAPPPLP